MFLSLCSMCEDGLTPKNKAKQLNQSLIQPTKPFLTPSTGKKNIFKDQHFDTTKKLEERMPTLSSISSYKKSKYQTYQHLRKKLREAEEVRQEYFLNEKVKQIRKNLQQTEHQPTMKTQVTSLERLLNESQIVGQPENIRFRNKTYHLINITQ